MTERSLLSAFNPLISKCNWCHLFLPITAVVYPTNMCSFTKHSERLWHKTTLVWPHFWITSSEPSTITLTVFQATTADLHWSALLRAHDADLNWSHSTETALIRVTNDLLLSSDRGCISLLVLLDLSAAFNTIDHNILLNRLKYSVGISGSALAWFKSYLSDHHRIVAVNEEVSYRLQVQYGVPQGSVLGPLLFTLYILRLGDIMCVCVFVCVCVQYGVPQGSVLGLLLFTLYILPLGDIMCVCVCSMEYLKAQY